MENKHLHQAIQWRYSRERKKKYVAAAVPRNKADILDESNFDQLKPKHALCHVQKSPHTHANMLNALHKASELCDFSPRFQALRDAY